ncbi:ABC transporter ATP-binding protein [Stagnimonas aquatica]|uniref:ABC transporter ATP-binding protein n=2 Tax=Stagnimonas aquatica TaxID=2689987 RepID=A0A3N0V7S8_9GAMM|nr:ABC transporter ATP-binding protein [Stagnimonas aquatica]
MVLRAAAARRVRSGRRRHGAGGAADPRRHPAVAGRGSGPRAGAQGAAAGGRGRALMLELHDLGVALDGRPVLRGLTLSVAAGERVVIAGPSGSGKSTLLRAIAGLSPVQSGEIRLDGRPVQALPPGQRDVAMMFQSYALFPHLSVLENLCFGLRARGMARRDAEDRARAAAHTLDLTPLLARRPRELSGGERQRVALTRALLREPKALLLDEPLSSLDTQLRVRARAEILKAHAGSRAAMLLVTHDQSEAMALADRLGVLHEGRLLQLAPPRTVYAEPANLFVARFLGQPAMNTLEVQLALDGGLWWGDQQLSRRLSPAPAAAGRRLVLGLRPEHLSLPGSRWAQDDPQQATLQATVEQVEPLGEQQIVWLQAGGQRLAARAEPELRVGRGVSLPLRLALGRASWFDPDSGEALSPVRHAGPA